MSNRILEEEFHSFVQKHLILSYNEMISISVNYCKQIFPDKKESCCWYHSAWQYLRILDKVSCPSWHFDFYYSAFNRLIAKGSKILISGSADFTILALIYFVVSKKRISAEIYVCDICMTPLLICEYFARCNEFKISIMREDIKNLNEKTEYDIITTDAFLTRFPEADKKMIVKKWSSLLKKNGKVVATLRIEDKVKQNAKIQILDKKDIYLNQIEKALTDSVLINEKEKVLKLAEKYIANIISFPFMNIKEIKELFRNENFLIESGETAIVKGEVQPTKYFRLITNKI